MRDVTSISKSGAEATDNPEIMTVTMLADYLRCHPSTIYRLLRQKRIPGFKIGSDWRFKKSVIDEWLREVTVSGVEF